MEQTLLELVEFFKKLSPEIWAILVKQAYIEAIGKLLWGIPWAIFAYILYKLRNMTDGHEYENAIRITIWAGILLFCLFSFLQIVESIKWFINPEFYAFRFLLREIIP